MHGTAIPNAHGKHSKGGEALTTPRSVPVKSRKPAHRFQYIKGEQGRVELPMSVHITPVCSVLPGSPGLYRLYVKFCKLFSYRVYKRNVFFIYFAGFNDCAGSAVLESAYAPLAEKAYEFK